MAHTVYNGSALQRQPSENVPPPGAVITQGDDVPTGVLTVSDEITTEGKTDERPFGDRVVFKDLGGKTWRCNESKLLRAASDDKAVFSPGRHLSVEYRESKPEGQTYPSRWINDARPAKDDEPDTYQPRAQGGGSGAPKSGFKKNGEFRTPEQIMRTSAVECAVAYSSKDNSLDDIILYAKAFYAWILGDFETKVEEVQEAFGATVEGDIPF